MVGYLSALFSARVTAQTDTLLLLPTFDLTTELVPWADRHTLYRTDSLPGSHYTTAAGVLADFGVPLKIYGPATLATTTVRGAGANHTAVRWNGLELNSPLNGTFDLNLAPNFLFDQIQLRSGGEAATEGANSMAATLNLRNDPEPVFPKNQLFGEVSLGSFDRRQYQFGYRTRLDNPGSGLDFRAVHQSGRNDFPRPDGTPTPNAESDLLAFSHRTANTWKTSNDTRFNLGSFGWWQRAQRQIPPSITQVNDTALQEDHSLKFGVNFNIERKFYRSKIIIGQIEEELWFESDVVRRSYSRGRRRQFSSDHLFSFGKQEVRLKLEHLRDRGTTENIGGRQRRIRKVAQLGYRRYLLRKNAWRFDANLRREMVENERIPLTWNTSLSYEHRRHNLALSAGRNYALPTFNDLYWSDALARGNPDLLSEDGYNFELNYRFRPSRWIDDLVLTVYRQSIRNRILWLPDDGGIYSPRNQREVMAGGLESYISKSLLRGPHRLDGRISYRFTRAVFHRLSPGDAPVILNKQLPYVPYHSVAATLLYRNRSWLARVDHRLQSARFTTSDNRNDLPGFGVTDVSLGYKLPVRRVVGELELYGRCANLWNTRYELIEARPLPGRAFQIGLRWR